MTKEEQALIDNLNKIKKVISQGDELTGKKIERLELRVQELTSIVNEFIDLVNNSNGVVGLHMNGAITTWEDLMENGWLTLFSEKVHD